MSGVAVIALVAMGAISVPYFTKVKLTKSDITIGSMHIGKVTKIQDGDTIEVDTSGNQVVIRFACVDSPESTQEPWGNNASNFLEDIIPVGSEVQYKTITTDRFSRSVSEVYKGDALINRELVAKGHAAVYTQYLSSCPDTKDTYLQAESKAKTQKLGFWNQSNVCLPWNFRSKKCQ